jgi:inhibitor of cysteine peptidase
MGLIGVVLTVCLVAGCGTEVKAYSDPEQTIETNVDNKFDIVLESNPTTGYSWEASYDQNQLKLVDKIYEEIEGPEELLGAGGNEIFRFKALKSGETQITMSYKRSWETEVLEQKVFTVDVK